MVWRINEKDVVIVKMELGVVRNYLAQHGYGYASQYAVKTHIISHTEEIRK